MIPAARSSGGGSMTRVNSADDNQFVEKGEIECRGVHAFVAYWESLRDGEEIPKVSKFDPMEFPEDLPWAAVCDCLDAGADFQFRLVGTKLVRIFDGDLTGKRLSDNPRDYVEGRLQHIYKTAVETAVPLYVKGRVGNVGGRAGFDSEGCVLPLADENGNVVRLVHMFRLRADDGAWIT